MEGIKLVVLYESPNFLVINKPPDLLINSNDVHEEKTLHRILIEQLPMDDIKSTSLEHGFHFVHRLDFATSGAICLAKNKFSSSLAGKLFESRLVNKYYLAILRGNVTAEFTSVDIAIGYDKTCLGSNKMMCVEGKNCLKPRKAKTNIMVLERGYYDGAPATKVMLKPLTGRRHQLRLHCAVLGHGIVGDYTYSGGKDVTPPRMFLHSHRLILPVVDEHIDILAPDPFNEHDWRVESVVNRSDDFNVFDKMDGHKFERVLMLENLKDHKL